MKIVMLARLFSPHVGGVEKHVEQIAREAARDGHEVTIVTSQYEKPLAYKSRLLKSADEVLIFRIPGLYKQRDTSYFTKIMERIRVWWWMLKHMLLFFHADIVHVHDIFWWYWPIRLLLPFKKVFITFHGFEAGRLPTTSAIRARRFARAWTKGNICVGAWIEKWYGTKATFVTYGAANCVSSKAKTRGSKSIKAIFVGRLEKDTGILSYIDVVMKMKSISLDIIGDGPLRKEIDKKIQKVSHLRFLGSVDNTCIVYPRYDVACVSSYLSMIEALQCGLPVIAFSTDTLKDDYLASFPAASDIQITTSPSELAKAFTLIRTGKELERAKKASVWAKRQTWEKVYSLYDRLWTAQTV